MKPLSIGKAARRLGVSVVTLRRWEEEGKITSIKTEAGHRKYTSEMLHKFAKPIVSRNVEVDSLPILRPAPLLTKPQHQILNYVAIVTLISGLSTAAVKGYQYYKNPGSLTSTIQSLGSNQVLGSQVSFQDLTFTVNVPTSFTNDVEITGNLLIDGARVNPNPLEDLIAGTGIAISSTNSAIINTDLGSAQNIFKTIKVGDATFTAGSNNDILTFAAGDDAIIALDSAAKRITISADVDIPDTGWVLNSGITALSNPSYLVGIGTSTGSAKLAINIDDDYTDLITASASGMHRLTLSNSGNLSISGSLTANGGISGSSLSLGFTPGSVIFQGASELNEDASNFTFNDSTDTLSVANLGVTNFVSSNLIPATGSMYDLGSSARRWATVYGDTANFTTFSSTTTTIAGTTVEDFLINTDNATNDTQDSTLTFERGIPGTNAQFKWDSTAKYVSVNSSFSVLPDTGITSSGKAALIVNQPFSTDIFTASAAGTTKFVINNSGYVGIGTSTPNTSLQVAPKIPTTSTGVISVGSTPWNDFAVQGDYAYIGPNSASTLEIYNISNPSAPTLISNSLNLGTAANPVLVQGRYLYIPTKGKVIDVSDPTNPSVVGNFASGLFGGADISGNYLYAAGNSEDLAIYDISNTTSPTLVNTFNIFGAANPSGSTQEKVKVVGKYAYVINGGTGAYGAFSIIDISNPLNPSVVGQVASLNAPGGIDIQGNFAYVTETGSTTLHIINIANKTSPQIVTSTSLLYTPTGPANGIEVQGRYLYLTGNGVAKLAVYDISNPTVPVLLGQIPTGTGPRPLVIQGRYAYLTTRNSNTLEIYDIGGTETPNLSSGNIDSGSILSRGSITALNDITTSGGLWGNSLFINTNAGIYGNTNILGSLGVGTVSPLAKFDVRGSSGTISVASVSGQTAFAAMVVDNNGVGDLFTASKSGATKFVITNAGDMGIGTAIPTAKTEIINNRTATPTLIVNGNSITSGSPYSAVIHGGLNGLVISGNDNADSFIPLNITQLAGGTPGAGTTIFRVTSAGNVGIGLGNTTPNSKLQVAGTASISGALTLYGTPTIQTTSNQSLILNPNGGNVGIGTATSGYKLEVSGTARINGNAAQGLHVTGGTSTGLYVDTSASSATAQFIGHAQVPLYTEIYHSGTNDVMPSVKFWRYTTDTPAAGFGTSIAFQLNTLLNSTRDSGKITSSWTDATDGTRTSAMAFSVVNNASELEAIRIIGNGNVGIGITPTDKLNVAGNILLNNTSKIYGSSNSSGGVTFNATGTIIGGGSYVGINLEQAGNYIDFTKNSVAIMRLAGTGELGIGTDTPITKLHVDGRTTGKALTVLNQTTGGDQNLLVASQAGVLQFSVGNDGTIYSSSLTGGATTLEVDANGNIIRTPSDATLKENVTTLSDSLDKVLQLNPVSYEYTDESRFGTGRKIGFIAQEVEALFPELVSDGGTYKSLDYSRMTAILAGAIQELNEKINNLNVTPASPAATLSDSLWDYATDSGKLVTAFPVQVPELTVTGKLTVGLVTIDDLEASISSLTGTVTIDGDLAVTGHLKVLGDSTGVTTMTAGLTSVEIETTAATSTSKILVTPTTLTDKVLTVTSKEDGKFKVEMLTPAVNDISFDWLVVQN